MRRNLFACAALTVCVLSTAAARADDRAQEGGGDVERLAGQWVLSSLLISGEEAVEEQVSTASLLIEGNRYSPRFEGADVVETFKLDPSTRPRSIDFTYVEGPRKGETVKGIYKLEGDRYTLCRPLGAEDPRPTEFASPPDSRLVLAVWMRDTEAERARRKAIDDDRKAFEGTWIGESNVRDGQVISDSDVKNVRLILTGNRYTLERGGDRASRGTCRIDPKTTPKSIDVNIIDGVNKGQTRLGIYQLSGDTYRLCFAPDGKPRPTKFDSEPGSGHILWDFRREKR